MKKYLIMFGVVSGLSFGLLFFYHQNKILKMTLAERETTIKSQKLSLDVFKEKQTEALKAVEIKEQEIKEIEQRRIENEMEFNQKASQSYHQWRVVDLPDDITRRMQ